MVEASRDSYWGAGADWGDHKLEQAIRENRLPGKNRLGAILMAIRTTWDRNTHRPVVGRIKNRAQRYHAAKAKDAAARRTHIQGQKVPDLPPLSPTAMDRAWKHFNFQLVPGTRYLHKDPKKQREVMETCGAARPAVLSRRR